jgi:signal peptidase I
VVFDPHHDIDERLVKRLIGFPGDTLEMRDATLIVNGTALPEPYLKPDTRADARSADFEWQREYLTGDVDRGAYTPSRRTWGPLVVPADHYFLLGDNRGDSYDSRYWGPLAAWRLAGRVSFIYFSFNKGSYRPFPALREIRWSRLGPFRSGVPEEPGR